MIETFKTEPRDSVGGGASRALRRAGLIPGILYGADKENVSLAVDPRDVMKGLHQAGFYSKIFELKIGGMAEQALARQVQFHPVTGQPIHIDFWRVTKGTKVHVSVPVVFINETKAPGIKRGGVLNVVLHSLELTCAADSIPEQITIDLEGLEIGDSIHTERLRLAQGVSVTHPERDITLATIVAPTVRKEETEEEAAPAEGAAS